MQGRNAAVVGAGIGGLSIAWHLAKRGFHVTVFDPNAPGSGCSSGNAGALSPGSIIPLATTRTVRGAAKMILDPAGALHIPPRYWFKAAPWLYRFVLSARSSRVAEISAALAQLHEPALERHREILREIGALDLSKVTGHLDLYRSPKSARFGGLWMGFGHGHLGLTASAVTGDLLGRAIAGEQFRIDLTPFSVDRF